MNHFRIVLKSCLFIFFAVNTFAEVNACKRFYQNVSTASFELNNLSTELPSKFSIQELSDKVPNLHLSEDFLDPETLTTFKKENPYYSIITIGERTIFLTRSKAGLEPMISERISGEHAFEGGAPKPKRIKEFPGFYAYDLSNAKYISPLIGKLAGTHAWDEGPNCWNLCQIYKGWARTAYTTDGSEFGLWVDGPFSKTVSAQSMFGLEPQKGDVIVLRSRGFKSGKMMEVHGAIALGYGLVFTKNGTNFEAKYQVSTLKDMLGTYLPNLSNTIEYKRIASFEEVWTEWAPQISTELKSLVDRWMAFETVHSDLYIPVKGEDPNVEVPQERYQDVQKIRHQLIKDVRAIVGDRLKVFDNRELNPTEKVEQFFWNLLKARASASYF